MIKKQLIWIGLFLLSITLLWWLQRDPPITVETELIRRSSFRVTIEDEGEIHAHDRYMVTSPITARLMRIDLHEGDAVKAGDVVAVLTPLPLSSWQRDELQARLTASIARQQESLADIARTQLLHEQALRESERSDKLLQQKLISQQNADDKRAQANSAAAVLKASRERSRAAEADVAAIRASLAAIDHSGRVEPLKLYAPVAGVVLNIIEKSERVLSSGAPILLLGDPSRLEAHIELLSTDAVNVKSNMPVELFGWGGDNVLAARVRTVEPSAFTKVSTLGLEEQRVRVVVDIESPPTLLGDGYHVEARIITWQSDNTLIVPLSAVFRREQNWAVFVVVDGLAQLRDIELGKRNESDAELLSGVADNERVVVYPPSDLQNGARVNIVQK